jgi:hypothetical protein
MKRHSLKKRLDSKKLTKSKRNKSKLSKSKRRKHIKKSRSTQRKKSKRQHKNTSRRRRSVGRKHHSKKDSGTPRLTNFNFYLANSHLPVLITQHEIDYENINFDEFKHIIENDLQGTRYVNYEFTFNFIGDGFQAGSINFNNFEEEFNNIAQRIYRSDMFNSVTLQPNIIGVQVHLLLNRLYSPAARSFVSDFSSIEQNPNDDNLIPDDMSDLSELEI